MIEFIENEGTEGSFYAGTEATSMKQELRAGYARRWLKDRPGHGVAPAGIQTHFMRGLTDTNGKSAELSRPRIRCKKVRRT